jgi:threonine/homoserine efflux transporter RhtA
LVGLVALSQGLAPAEVAGIVCVVAASAGVLREPGATAPRD